MRPHVRSVPLLLVVLAALTVTGCSGEDAPDAAATPGASPQAAESPESDDAPSDSGAGVEQVDLSDVLVEQTLTAVDDPEDAVQVGVLSLEVQDEVMRLELVVTPDLASVPDDERQSIYDLRGFYDDPALIDRDNLKRYEVVSAGPGKRYESEPVTTDTVNGRPMRLYYYFAAPQDDIDAIDVVLSDRYPAFTDVPIT